MAIYHFDTLPCQAFDICVFAAFDHGTANSSATNGHFSAIHLYTNYLNQFFQTTINVHPDVRTTLFYKKY